MFVRHWRQIQIALLKAAPGIEHDGSGSILTPHYFRHNYASILYRSGVDVLSAQLYLGHTDPATTMRIYTHLAEEMELKDAEKVRKRSNDLHNSGLKSGKKSARKSLLSYVIV